jgi:hypothetical protein
MLNDGILEDYENPLTLVPQEHKPLRMCLDARGVKRQMIPDRVKVAPITELLQSFHGSKDITTLDLSSAFLRYHWLNF